MITSDKQYAASKKQLVMLSASMAASRREDVADFIEQAGMTQMQELADEIQRDMEEYVWLR